MRLQLVLAMLVTLAVAAGYGAPADGAAPRGASEASFTTIPVRIRGALAVQFHGDQATGCAAHGFCGLSGTVVWQPPPTATLDTAMYSIHGRTEYDVALDLFDESQSGAPVNGGITTADVRLAPNGSAGSSTTCTDAAATGADIEMPVHLRAASLTLAAAAPSLLGTRCAGPLQSDIASALPRRVVDVATLSHGRAGVSLAATGDFAVNGFAGTVKSTVELSLGRPHTQRAGNGNLPPSGPHLRTVVITYRSHLDGSLVAHVHGDPSSCAPLGSCGANGAFALRVHSMPGTLAISATTRARRPLRDALTALGLRKDGNPRGIGAFGFFTVRGPAGYAVDVRQGATTCRDSGATASGIVSVGLTRGRVAAALFPALRDAHLRCPGPVISEEQPIAFGATRLGGIGRHGGTIHLATGTNLDDDGYSGRTSSSLALTLSDPKLKVVTDALPGRG